MKGKNNILLKRQEYLFANELVKQILILKIFRVVCYCFALGKGYRAFNSTWSGVESIARISYHSSV